MPHGTPSWPAGYGHIGGDPNAPIDQTINVSGDAGDTDKVQPGMPITHKGNNYTLTGEQDEQGRALATGPTGQAIWLPPGTYTVTGTNQTITIGGPAGGPTALFGEGEKPQGAPVGIEVGGDGQLYATYSDGSVKKVSEADLKRMGLGGGGGSAPDVVGTANAWMRYYELQVRNGLMPYEQAVAARDRKFEELNAVIDTEIAQGTFEQTAAIYTNQAQSQFDANQLRQQEEFGSRAQSMVQDFLPNFMPGLTGANIPGVTGTMPVPQVNPDQIYGLGALAGAGPTAPVPIPNPQITPFDPSQLPQVPNYTPPPLPNILGLLGIG